MKKKKEKIYTISDWTALFILILLFICGFMSGVYYGSTISQTLDEINETGESKNDPFSGKPRHATNCTATDYAVISTFNKELFLCEVVE